MGADASTAGPDYFVARHVSVLYVKDNVSHVERVLFRADVCLAEPSDGNGCQSHVIRSLYATITHLFHYSQAAGIP